MSNYIEYKLPFLFSSNPLSGALNVSSDGSSFDVLFDQPIVVPREAKNCYITVQSATAWWNIFNIIDGENDQIDVYYDDGVSPIQELVTIEPGLYDLDHLSAEIQREILAFGFPEDLFTLVPDQATQKTVIQFNYTGVQLDLSVTRNFAAIMGFEERLVPQASPTTSPVEYEKSDNIANFNTVEYLLIHSDLVSRGIRINGEYRGIIAQLLIDVAPGSQIISRPFNPPEIPANELIGEKRKNIRIYLTDQNSNPVNTQNEIFSCRLVIHYSMSS